jgi:hypothetical protein
MAISYTTAGDIVHAALEFYIKGPVHSQTMQERPTLKKLLATKQTFPGGKEYISMPIQGRYMSDNADFHTGYSGADTLTFQQTDDILRAKYKWYEIHAGLKITWSELKQDGVHISDNNKKSESSNAEVTRLTGILENRLSVFSESWAREQNEMFWRDGTQDPKKVPGITSILTNTPTVGTTGGVSRSDPDGEVPAASYWQHHYRLASAGNALVSSATNQTMTKGLRSLMRQLIRYGGGKFAVFAGSTFIEKLEDEVHEKGVYTQDGFVNSGKNDVGMSDIWLRGLGMFQYDPTMDELELDNKCVIWDTRRLKLWPMEQEEDKLLNPERPYDQAMFLRSMTWTGGMACNQLNACAVVEVAA